MSKKLNCTEIETPGINEGVNNFPGRLNYNSFL